MRTPSSSKDVHEASRFVRNEAAGAVTCSPAAVFWDIGLFLAVFFGLTLTITATLTAFGIN